MLLNRGYAADTLLIRGTVLLIASLLTCATLRIPCDTHILKELLKSCTSAVSRFTSSPDTIQTIHDKSVVRTVAQHAQCCEDRCSTRSLCCEDRCSTRSKCCEDRCSTRSQCCEDRCSTRSQCCEDRCSTRSQCCEDRCSTRLECCEDRCPTRTQCCGHRLTHRQHAHSIVRTV